MKTSTKVIGLLILTHAIMVAAEPPALIHYQGRLVDGTNPYNGVMNLELQLYSASVGGTHLYSDVSSENVVDGLYSTVIGDNTTLGSLPTALDNPEVWLQVVVNGTPLSPRERLVAVPYARMVHGMSVGTNRNVTINPGLSPLNPLSIPNLATGFGSVVGGGHDNRASGFESTVSGGYWNFAQGSYSAVGGGYINRVLADYGTIAGGGNNGILAEYGTIAGGEFNSVTGQHATVSGGQGNTAHDPYAVIAGGGYNEAYGWASVVGGGEANIAMAANAVVGGGSANTASGYASTVGGGWANQSTAESTVVGGGQGNTAGNDHDVISGGKENDAQGGTAFIGGGQGNSVMGLGSAIGGGLLNSVIPTLTGDTMSARWSTIGGGVVNIISNANESTIGGGSGNRINSTGSTIGGGQVNIIASSAPRAVIGGGYENYIAATNAVIAGGYSNIASGVHATVSGGRHNTASGYASTVGGGHLNVASGSYATVPGGRENVAAGGDSFAAGIGSKALHGGTFVWSDGLTPYYASTAPDQFLVRAGGGAGFNTTTPVAPLHVEGADPTTQFSGQLAISGVTALGVSNSGAGLRLIGHDGGIARDWGFIRALKSNSTVGNTQSHMIFGTRAHGGGLLERMRLDNGGLTVNGTFVSASDREKKQDIVLADPQVILDRVMAMPVHYWRYKDDPETLHVGPMAQDFHAAFGLGPDDRHIASVDADGIALAAIQALAQQQAVLASQNDELRQENLALRERIQTLEARAAQ
jgi:trimeric autotransporter adhesin